MLADSKITKLGQEAISQAREENRIFGLPNVISKDGKILYELPSGEIKESYNWNLK